MGSYGENDGDGAYTLNIPLFGKKRRFRAFGFVSFMLLTAAVNIMVLLPFPLSFVFKTLFNLFDYSYATLMFARAMWIMFTSSSREPPVSREPSKDKMKKRRYHHVEIQSMHILAGTFGKALAEERIKHSRPGSPASSQGSALSSRAASHLDLSNTHGSGDESENETERGPESAHRVSNKGNGVAGDELAQKMAANGEEEGTHQQQQTRERLASVPTPPNLLTPQLSPLLGGTVEFFKTPISGHSKNDVTTTTNSSTSASGAATTTAHGNSSAPVPASRCGPATLEKGIPRPTCARGF